MVRGANMPSVPASLQAGHPEMSVAILEQTKESTIIRPVDEARRCRAELFLSLDWLSCLRLRSTNTTCALHTPVTVTRDGGRPTARAGPGGSGRPGVGQQ